MEFMKRAIKCGDVVGQKYVKQVSFMCRSCVVVKQGRKRGISGIGRTNVRGGEKGTEKNRVNRYNEWHV